MVVRAGPGLTVQDLGRPGWLAQGVSRGGAMDRAALHEAAALLDQKPDLAAIEMPPFGGEFAVQGNLRIALTGASMPARLDGASLAWNACHRLADGQRLVLGAATRGTYGYLAAGGGFATPATLGSRSAHLAAGIGRALEAGDVLPVGDDPHLHERSVRLPAPERFGGGEVRIVPTLHTALYPDAERRRFEATDFARSARGNRQGVTLDFDGPPFGISEGATVLSEPMIAGDIQMTGDGLPVVLAAECQSVGGFPRIAQVLPCDLPRVVQAAPGERLRFRFVSLEDGDAAMLAFGAELRALPDRLRPLIRRVEDVGDLLGYQLVSGAVTGDEAEEPSGATTLP